MANENLKDALLSALAHDSPSEWVAYFKEAREQAGNWEKLAFESQDFHTKRRAKLAREACSDMTDADFSGKIFDSRLYSDGSFTRRIAEPEKYDNSHICLNMSAQDDYFFPGVNFKGTSFENAILRGCSFSFNDFSDVNAKNTIFAGCRFMPTDDGAGSCFENADLSGALFHVCALNKLHFRDADLRGATFNRCNFAGYEGSYWSAFPNIDLSGVKFLHCDLSKSGVTLLHLKQCASIEGSELPPRLQAVRAEIEEAIEIGKMPERLAQEKHKQEEERQELEDEKKFVEQLQELEQIKEKRKRFRRPSDLNRTK